MHKVQKFFFRNRWHTMHSIWHSHWPQHDSLEPLYPRNNKKELGTIIDLASIIVMPAKTIIVGSQENRLNNMLKTYDVLYVMCNLALLLSFISSKVIIASWPIFWGAMQRADQLAQKLFEAVWRTANVLYQGCSPYSALRGPLFSLSIAWCDFGYNLTQCVLGCQIFLVSRFLVWSSHGRSICILFL